MEQEKYDEQALELINQMNSPKDLTETPTKETIVPNVENNQVVFHNDANKPVDEQASDIITGVAYQEAIKDKKLQDETVESASADIRAKNKVRTNKAKTEEQQSNIEMLKNVTSAKIESDEAHYKRHLVVLSRWGINKVIPKPVAILYEIFGYCLQFLFIISIGWLIYTSKFVCETFSGLGKGVWAVIGSTVGLGVLSLIIWGIYELFVVLQGVGV